MTDIIMPVMNGRRLAEQIQASRQEIRVLFTSGYTANVILRYGVDEGVEFLAKPYRSSPLPSGCATCSIGGQGPRDSTRRRY